MASRKKTAKRSGRTTNVSVSLDATIMRILRARANDAHAGNLSAAIAEAAVILHRQIARDEVAADLMKGRPPLTDDDRAAIDAELEAGWAQARRHSKKRSRAA